MAVAVCIPEESLNGLYADEVNPIYHRLQAANIELQVTPGSGVTVDGAWLLAEAGGATWSSRWASTSARALVPDSLWNSAVGNTRYLVLEADAPLGVGPGRELRTGELPRALAGAFHERRVRSELDGPIQALGTRFWKLVSDHVPELSSRLSSGPGLRAVRLGDRYLKSPLTALLVREVLQGLTGQSGGIASQTNIRVTTTAAENRRPPHFLHHDWATSQRQEEVLRQLLGGLGGNLDLHVVPRGQSRHERSLELVWPDEYSLQVRLDHGLGFLRIAGPPPAFPFGRSASDQCGALLQSPMLGRSVQNHEGEALIYVSGLTNG
jgi:hypothetical protein